MYETVLFPTDGDTNSERACEDAVEPASLDEATVELLTEAGDTDRETVEASLESDAKEFVEDAVEEARKDGVEVEGEVRHGKPDDEIVEYAQETDADLIVMGTKERMDEYRDILGSVTESVLRNASRRVMVVKTQPDLPPESSIP